MNGEKYGKYLVAVILLIAAGTMVSASFAHYEAEMAAEESYYEGMAEMHNSMMGTSLSVEDIILLHEENECPMFPNLGKY